MFVLYRPELDELAGPRQDSVITLEGTVTGTAFPLDFDRLAVLRLRLRYTREPDLALGCAIIALLLPGTIAAVSAAAWLDHPEDVVGAGLDITGSVEDALRFLGQLGFGPGWSIVRENYDAEPQQAGDASYGVRLRRRFFDCLGCGLAPATALVDVAIHATARGAASYTEEDLLPLEPGDRSTRDNAEKQSVLPVMSESNGAQEMILSKDPVKRTRQVLGQCWPNLGMIDDLRLVAVIELTGRLCLTNRDGRFGAMDGYELDAGILRVVDQNAPASTRFDTLEDLLAAGWMLD